MRHLLLFFHYRQPSSYLVWFVYLIQSWQKRIQFSVNPGEWYCIKEAQKRWLLLSHCYIFVVFMPAGKRIYSLAQRKSCWGWRLDLGENWTGPRTLSLNRAMLKKTTSNKAQISLVPPPPLPSSSTTTTIYSTICVCNSTVAVVVQASLQHNNFHL